MYNTKTYFLKRIFDIVTSFAILILISPIFFVVYFLVKFSSEGPAFFLQERLGINGKTFIIYKFRTMTNKKRISDQEIVGNHPEVTYVGKWLRRFKIDELPQIINVIRGDMSIVGPRPTLLNQLEEINLYIPERLSVRPGLTGLAQVNGNIYLNWSDRWKYDIEYIKNISFMLDMKILFKTILVVFLGEKSLLNKPS